MSKLQLLHLQAEIGDEVRIILTKGETVHGLLTDMGPEHVVLAANDRSVTIFAEMLGGWEILRSRSAPVLVRSSEKGEFQDDLDSPSSNPIERSEVQHKIIEIEVRFRENIDRASIIPLTPTFDFPEAEFSGTDRAKIQREWNRLRDQFAYAQKIKELSRLNQQLVSWKQVAEEFPLIGVLHFNIGCLYSILGNQTEALASLQNACCLYDSSECWYNLACVAHRLERKSLVCYALERFFQQSAPASALSAWYVFVGVLPEFQNYKSLFTIFETSVQSTSSNDQIRLVLETGVYLLRSAGRHGRALEVLSEMLDRGTEANRAVALLSSVLLDFPQVPTAEYQQAVESLTSARAGIIELGGLTANRIKPPGYITAYFRGRGFGFIEAVTGDPVFFHMKSVEDSALKTKLENFVVGDRIPVWYESRESPERKYPQCIRVSRFESPDDIVARATSLANAGQVNAALVQLQKAIKLDPNNRAAQSLDQKWRSAVSVRHERPGTLPKGEGPYSLAKRATTVEKDFQTAEKLYTKAIKEDDNKDSAIKDLASLFQQQDRHEEAIALLQRHRPSMSDKRSVDNMLATFFQHMGRHRDAIKVLERLLDSTPEHSKPVLLRRIALSQFKSQDYATADKTLHRVLTYLPTDSTAQRWLAALEKATASGEYSAADEVITAPEVLADYAGGLSSFAIFHLDHCDFQGVEPSKVNTREFTESDVDRLENLAKKLGAKRPRDRAAYYLSAAKILSSIQPDDLTRIYSYLRRCFASMGDAALENKRHPDIARAFYCESFSVSRSWEWKLDEPKSVLARYLDSFLTDLEKVPDTKTTSVADTVKRLFANRAADDRLFDAILYVSIFSREAANRLLDAIFRTSIPKEQAVEFLRKRGVPVEKTIALRDHREFLSLWQQLRQEIAERQARRYAEFMYLRQVKVATDSLEDFVRQIDRLMQDPSFDLDGQRLVSLRQVALTIHEFCAGSDFEEQERLSSVAVTQCGALKSEVINSPTKLSLESLLPIVDQLSSLTEERIGEIMRTSRPEVEVNLPVETYTPNVNSEIKLQLSVTNSIGSSPAVSPTLIFEPRPAYFQMSTTQCSLDTSLRGGATRTVQIPMRVTNEALRSQAFPISVRVKYRNRGGETQETEKSDLTVRLYPAEGFEEITNPYAAYAEGGPVVEHEMFYGRDELVSNLVHAILSGESRNKSVVIYGQKRAGKSSVLLHLENRLSFPVIAVSFSVQDIETELSYEAFLYRILQRLAEAIENEVYKGRPAIEFSLPSIPDFMKHPMLLFHQTLSEFQRACKRTKEWSDGRIVLLIDEFSDIYKEILRGRIPESFMKNWKALIEKQYFGVVLVGQDVMRKFMDRFSNEFGILQEERITYLAEKYARMLIEDPTRIPGPNGAGESRFRARAAERILELTAGSPFYVQIICNRLIDYMNDQKAKYVTDADVERVKNELLTGVNSLRFNKFDNLLTAGDAALEEINPGDTLAVCRALAIGSRVGWCNVSAIACQTATPVIDILKDLDDRDVVEKKGASDYRLRVGLFREWLVTNQ